MDGMKRVRGREFVGPRDAELFQPASEGARVEAELPGGAVRPINPPICLLKGPSNMRVFQIMQSRGRLSMPVGTGGREQAHVVAARLCRQVLQTFCRPDVLAARSSRAIPSPVLADARRPA